MSFPVPPIFCASTYEGGFERHVNGHSFVWETQNWEVIPAGDIVDARLRGEINTYAVTGDEQAVPITVSVLAAVDHPGMFVCGFRKVLVRSDIAALDGSSIRSVSGEVSGIFR